jgi:hypothetical protein
MMPIGLDELKDFKRKLATLEAVRARIEPQWREIRDYVFPDRGFFSKLGDGKDDGTKRRRLVINGTSALAVNTLSDCRAA